MNVYQRKVNLPNNETPVVFDIIGLTTAELEIIEIGIVNTKANLSDLESCEDHVDLCNDLYLKIDKQLILSKS